MSEWQGIVEMFRRVNTAKGRIKSGRFSIEGIRLHERALRAQAQIERALLGESFQHNPSLRIQQLISALQASSCILHVVPDKVINELTQGRSLGDILGLLPIPTQPDLAQLVATQTEKPLLFLTAVDLVDPGNLGALIRTGHASGITAFITIGTSDPFHPKAVRTTMGSLFKVPLLRYATVASLLHDLHKLDIKAVGTAVNQGTPLPTATFSQIGTAVFMGNEYQGLPQTVITQLDSVVSIPMINDIDSFSVNAAAAIILYEIRRHFLA